MQCARRAIVAAIARPFESADVAGQQNGMFFRAWLSPSPFSDVYMTMHSSSNVPVAWVRASAHSPDRKAGTLNRDVCTTRARRCVGFRPREAIEIGRAIRVVELVEMK